MNAITRHPAYPSSHDLRVERRAETIAAADLLMAETLRATLMQAHAAIARATFNTGWPVGGYDKEDALALLLELAGEEADVRREIETRAQQLAEEDEAAAEFDAAEFNAAVRADQRRIWPDIDVEVGP